MMTDVRTAAIEWTCRCLGEEFPALAGNEAHELAEAMVAIACEYDVPIQDGLLAWIRWQSGARKRSGGRAEWTTSDWLRWCEKYSATRSALEAQRVCPNCYASSAAFLGGRWVCGKCGEVQ
jgi:ribosomal protein S27AE